MPPACWTPRFTHDRLDEERGEHGEVADGIDADLVLDLDRDAVRADGEHEVNLGPGAARREVRDVEPADRQERRADRALGQMTGDHREQRLTSSRLGGRAATVDARGGVVQSSAPLAPLATRNALA